MRGNWLAISVSVSRWQAAIAAAPLDRKVVLLFGILREVQPELGHAKPMGLRFEGRRGSGERQAALRAGPEFVGKVHGLHHPLR